MMFLWAACGVPFGAYAIIQNFNIPIQVQPQCFMVLSIVSWVQILMYSQYVAVGSQSRRDQVLTRTLVLTASGLPGKRLSWAWW